jgi:hypothetical protein
LPNCSPEHLATRSARWSKPAGGERPDPLANERSTCKKSSSVNRTEKLKRGLKRTTQAVAAACLLRASRPSALIKKEQVARVLPRPAEFKSNRSMAMRCAVADRPLLLRGATLTASRRSSQACARGRWRLSCEGCAFGFQAREFVRREMFV